MNRGDTTLVDVVVVQVPSPVTVVQVQVPGIPGSPGNFTGPVGATDNAVVRFDGTTGTLGQNSLVTIDDNGKINAVAGATGTASINVPHGVAPSAPVNGDFWSTTAAFFGRLNGATQTMMTLAGGTMTGLIATVASVTGGAGLRVPHGTAPSAPVNGDIWSTTAAFFGRLNGTTVQFAVITDISGVYMPLAGGTFTGKVTMFTSAAGNASMTLPHGAAPSSPVNGDVWSTTANFFVRINGATKTVAVLESPAFTGTPTAPTATAGDSSTQVATTAFINTEVENAQSGTSYTLALTDVGKMVTLTNAAAITLTVPTNATVAIPVGSRIDIAQGGAGQVTVGGAGITFKSFNSLLKLAGNGAGGTLWKQGTNTWYLFGQLA